MRARSDFILNARKASLSEKKSLSWPVFGLIAGIFVAARAFLLYKSEF
jgi:hypothetical protein